MDVDLESGYKLPDRDALGSQLEDLACFALSFFPRFDGPCLECDSSLRPLSVDSFVSKLSKSCRSATLGLTIGIQDEAFVSENGLVTIGVLLEQSRFFLHT